MKAVIEFYSSSYMMKAFYKGLEKMQTVSFQKCIWTLKKKADYFRDESILSSEVQTPAWLQ